MYTKNVPYAKFFLPEKACYSEEVNKLKSCKFYIQKKNIKHTKVPYLKLFRYQTLKRTNSMSRNGQDSFHSSDIKEDFTLLPERSQVVKNLVKDLELKQKVYVPPYQYTLKTQSGTFAQKYVKQQCRKQTAPVPVKEMTFQMGS